MRFRFVFGGAVLGLSVSTVAGCVKSGGFVRKIEHQYCAAADDDLGGNYFIYLKELEDGGEEARVALLKLANSDRPARACAVSFLCELEDERVSVVLERILHEPAAKRGSRRYSEQLVALECISKQRMSYPAYVADLLSFVDEGGTLELRAIDILGSVDDPIVRRRLRQLLDLAGQESSARRYVVVKAVGLQNDLEALDALVELAQHPNIDNGMRFQLAIALLRIEAVSNIELIRSLVEGMDNFYLKTGPGQEILQVLRELRSRRDAEGRTQDVEKIQFLIDRVERLLGTYDA